MGDRIPEVMRAKVANASIAVVESTPFGSVGEAVSCRRCGVQDAPSNPYSPDPWRFAQEPARQGSLLPVVPSTTVRRGHSGKSRSLDSEDREHSQTNRWVHE
jgi:hypothetical protein